jgi:hypothetical protein
MADADLTDALCDKYNSWPDDFEYSPVGVIYIEDIKP